MLPPIYFTFISSVRVLPTFSKKKRHNVFSQGEGSGKNYVLGRKIPQSPPLAHSQAMGVTDMVTSSSDFGSDGPLVTYKDNGFLPLLYA